MIGPIQGIADKFCQSRCTFGVFGSEKSLAILPHRLVKSIEVPHWFETISTFKVIGPIYELSADRECGGAHTSIGMTVLDAAQSPTQACIPGQAGGRKRSRVFVV
jgi:hypothetical protein